MSSLKMLAASGFKGSSALGSVSNEHIDNKSLSIVNAGLQFF